MKSFFLTAFIGMTLAGWTQNVQYTLASYTGPDKIAIAKSSIEIPAWHERSFWRVYEDYIAQSHDIEANNQRSLISIASLSEDISDDDALLAGQNLLAHSYEMLSIQKRYYREIAETLNGVIAMQFLQTELLFDLMESSKIYESGRWKTYRFHPNSVAPEQLKRAKYNSIQNAMQLDATKKTAFMGVYLRYEDEVDAMLGEEYSVIGLYAGEPTDYTPALAKRLGSDLLELRERELKLKEKYFLQMKNTVGAKLAAKFLGWEDYYSSVSKMYAWADSQ